MLKLGPSCVTGGFEVMNRTVPVLRKDERTKRGEDADWSSPGDTQYGLVWHAKSTLSVAGAQSLSVELAHIVNI